MKLATLELLLDSKRFSFFKKLLQCNNFLNEDPNEIWDHTVHINQVVAKNGDIVCFEKKQSGLRYYHPKPESFFLENPEYRLITITAILIESILKDQKNLVEIYEHKTINEYFEELNKMNKFIFEIY